MRKKVFSLIFCLSGIAIFPSVVLGEGLLSDTGNNIVQQGANQTANTESMEKTISPTIENVVNEPADTVVNTVPVAEKVVEKASDYAEKTTSEVGKSMENVPVVAPVVKKAEQTVNKVIIKVNGTVKKTVKIVPAVTQKINDKTKDAVDKVGNLPTDVKLVNTDYGDTTIETSKLVEETKVSAVSNTAESTSSADKEDDEPSEITLEDSFESEPLEENTKLGTLKQSSSNDRKADSPLKHSGDKRDQDFIVSTNTIFQNSPLNGGPTSASLFYDYTNIGVLSSFNVMQAATEKLWYHKNSYAIIQWFHTPLRKPPEHTPFLYVM